MRKIVGLSLLIAGLGALVSAGAADAWRGCGYPHVRSYYHGFYGPSPHPHYTLRHRHGRDYAPRGLLGRIEVEAKPKDAQVYVDGYYVGTANKLDGFPDHLWLRQGTYEITLVHPGFKTVSYDIAVFPRQRLELETEMEPGESTPPPPPEGKAEAKAKEGPEVETARPVGD